MWTGVIAAATALLLAGCIPGGPPTPEQVNDQFAETIEPVWEVDIDGIFGEPVVRDGLVFAYAIDEADGMRLEVRSLENGELVWEHAASPGGAYSNPILESVNSAGRAYPLPAMRPIVMERAADGEDGKPQLVVVYFERDIPETESISPDDMVRVADARTGDLLEVTFEPFDEFEYRPYGTLDDGDVFLNALDPGRPCGESRICFLGSDGETTGATAMVALDLAALVLEYAPAVFTEPADGITVYPEWGAGYASLLTDESTLLARYQDGQVLWQVDFDTLFDGAVLSPPTYIDFVEVGGLVLVQGYRGLVETLDPELPHTLDIDFVASRALVAVDPDTGEVIWRVPGADMHCSSVHQRTIASDAKSIPVCLATAGSFVYDLGSESMLEQEDIVASIAELKVSDGSIGWEVPEVGETALANVGRLVDAVWASRGDLAVVAPVDSTSEEEEGSKGGVQLVDLTTGDALPVAEDAQLVCKMERDDVLPEFEGSSFASGTNPITTGYPAGWYHYPCGTDGVELEDWSKGAVRIAGYSETGGDGKVVVLPTEGGLVAFEVE